MKKNDQWYIDRYVRAVSSWLPCSRKQKRQIKLALRQRLEEYISSGGNAAALETHFGTPNVIAAAYVDDMDTGELLQALRYRRRIVRIITVGIVAALAIFTAALCVELYDNHLAMNGWDVITIIED